MKSILLFSLLAIAVLFLDTACVTNKTAPAPMPAATTTTTTDSQEVHTY